jgi:hypothetical protein
MLYFEQMATGTAFDVVLESLRGLEYTRKTPSYAQDTICYPSSSEMPGAESWVPRGARLGTPDRAKVVWRRDAGMLWRCAEDGVAAWLPRGDEITPKSRKPGHKS